MGLLAGWLDDAEEKTSDLPVGKQAAAQAALVYYRAYDYKAQLLLNEPASKSLGRVSRSYLESQIARWERMAAQYLLEYEQVIMTGKAVVSGTRFSRINVTF